MYLRQTSRRNRDGSTVSYLALAHNVRDPDTGTPRAQIIHSFGRADRIDRDALGRLVASISRFLDPADAVAAAADPALGQVTVLDSRPMGVAFLADQLWSRLGIAEAIVDALEDRRLDAEQVERALFAMVANRLSSAPTSKLAGCRWVAERVFIDRLSEVSDDACYRAMDVLMEVLPGLQEQVFFSVANLLNLEVDLIFFDSSSTFWQTETADDGLLADLADQLTDEGDDEDRPRPVEGATRVRGDSKDHRGDLPQVVLGMAVTREGMPVRVWTFPGNTSDQTLLRTVTDDLAAWRLNRVIWVLDRGFTSAANRRYLQRAGGSYILGEKLRGGSAEATAALKRQGRYHTVAGNLRVKEVRLDGVAHDRFIICHNPQRARRDAAIRQQIVARLEAHIDGSDQLDERDRAELAGKLKTRPTFNRFLRTTPTGKLRIDRGAITADAKLDGKFLLRTPDQSLTPADIAQAYKALHEAERGWRDLKTIQLQLRPVRHFTDRRIQAHIQICWLALLILRAAELATGDTWRNLRDELDRLHLVTLATQAGTVAQRGELTAGQRTILTALDLPEPPRFYDFAPATD